MKQLTCEMCGGTDLIKQDGVFVCQTCGCKYSIDEAKKMMVEGTVDIKGTVLVDNSQFVEKYLQNARRAKEKEDWEETEKYYNLVEQNQPQNIEAIFYSSYGRAKMSLVDGDFYKRQQTFKVLTNCVSIIDDNYDVTQSIENEKVIKAMSNDIIAMRLGNFVFTEWKNGYGIVTRTNKGETITLFNVLEVTFIKALENIIAKDNKSYLYDIIIIHCKLLIEAGELAESSKDFWLKKIDNTKNQSEGLAEQEKKARIESYWSTHADDKTELENEKSKAQSHLTALNEEMDAIPGLSDKKALEEKIDTLKAEKDSIWLFRGKEKKAKQTEIDSLVERVKTLNLTVEPTVNEVQTKIDAVNKRIREIDDELTKDRQ